jgi:hypothetical protein
MKKTIFLFLIVLFVVSATMASVFAAPTGAQVRNLNSSRGSPTGAIGSVYAQAGNVSELEINGTMITKAWQGFFGNISGNISLEDSNGYRMYRWGLGTTQGEVYAARVNTVNFATINCSNKTLVTAEETALGMGATDADNISATFSIGPVHPTFSVGSNPVNSSQDCYTTYTYVNNASQAANLVYAEVLLHDLAENIVYTALINDSATGFDNEGHDFQMLVPEDGHTPAAEAALTQYYFWVELG